MINDQMLLSAYEGLAPGQQQGQDGGDGGYVATPRRRRRSSFAPNEHNQHEWERVADELKTYMEEMPDQLAEAMMPQGRAPFTAAAPRSEQVDFWLTRLVLPDGTVNLPAVDELLASATPAEVHGLADAIRERHTNLAATVQAQKERRQLVTTSVPTYPSEGGVAA